MIPACIHVPRNSNTSRGHLAFALKGKVLKIELNPNVSITEKVKVAKRAKPFLPRKVPSQEGTALSREGTAPSRGDSPLKRGQPPQEGTAPSRGDSPLKRGQPSQEGTALSRGDSPLKRGQPSQEGTCNLSQLAT